MHFKITKTTPLERRKESQNKISMTRWWLISTFLFNLELGWGWGCRGQIPSRVVSHVSPQRHSRWSIVTFTRSKCCRHQNSFKIYAFTSVNCSTVIHARAIAAKYSSTVCKQSGCIWFIGMNPQRGAWPFCVIAYLVSMKWVFALLFLYFLPLEVQRAHNALINP